jgi:hypothetical protein
MGTVGQWVGGIIGGVIGYIAGGPWGAFYGFTLGMGLGGMIDPLVPDRPTPGEPMKDVEIMTNQEGMPLPDVLGTTKLTGNLLWYGNNRMMNITEEVGSGGIFGGSEDVVTGYRYYLSWAMGICLGPVDTLYTIYKDDKVVWAGELNRPAQGWATLLLIEDYSIQLAATDSTGYGINEYYVEQITLNAYRSDDSANILQGMCFFYFGTMDQPAHGTLGTQMLQAGSIPDLNYNIPYRGQCYAYFYDNMINTYNRCPTMKFVIKKTPDCSFDP